MADYKLLHRLRREYKKVSYGDILLSMEALKKTVETQRDEIAALNQPHEGLRARVEELLEQNRQYYLMREQVQRERNTALTERDAARHRIVKLEHQRDILIDALDRLE